MNICCLDFLFLKIVIPTQYPYEIWCHVNRKSYWKPGSFTGEALKIHNKQKRNQSVFDCFSHFILPLIKLSLHLKRLSWKASRLNCLCFAFILKIHFLSLSVSLSHINFIFIFLLWEQQSKKCLWPESQSEGSDEVVYHIFKYN